MLPQCGSDVADDDDATVIGYVMYFRFVDDVILCAWRPSIEHVKRTYARSELSSACSNGDVVCSPWLSLLLHGLHGVSTCDFVSPPLVRGSIGVVSGRWGGLSRPNPVFFSKRNQHGTYCIPWYMIISKLIIDTRNVQRQLAMTQVIRQICWKTECIDMCLLRSPSGCSHTRHGPTHKFT